MKRVLIVANEAGGAEVVSSWVRKELNSYNYFYYLGDLAFDIFRRKLGEIRNISHKIEKLIKEFDIILTGTGIETSFERDTIRLGKRFGIKTISILDHWTNYCARFGDPPVFPDEIWVTDEYAYNLARKLNTKIILMKENPYFVDIKSELDHYRVPENNNRRILYVCEPGKWKYTDLECVDYFINSLKLFEEHISEVSFRLHPLESPHKYCNQIKKYTGRINLFLSLNDSIIRDCIWADIVVGIQSMGLIVAVFANKKVFSYMPGEECCLPYKEILHIDFFEEILHLI